jgi:hypothetical protein
MNPMNASQALRVMLAATTQVMRQHPDTQPYLLADGAWIRHGSASVRAMWSRIKGTPLLGDSEAGWAGPLLFPLALEGDSLEPLRPLLDPATMLPFGSILCSAMERPQLATHLYPLADVRLEDDTEMLMRFADPRVLPFWLDALEGPYRNYAACCASAWVHWQPDFSVRTWADGDPHALAGELPFPMPLKDTQQQAMMDACFVHLVLGDLIASDDAAAMKAVPAQHRYGFVNDQLQRAMRWGLTHTADLHAYCTTALTYGARFDETPLVADALRTAASEGWPAVTDTLATRGWPAKEQG